MLNEDPSLKKAVSYILSYIITKLILILCIKQCLKIFEIKTPT